MGTKKIASLAAAIAITGSFAADAAPITFDFTYSGANLAAGYVSRFGSSEGGSNTVTATGSFTLADASLLNGTYFYSAGSQVTNFTMTVSGATTGDGTFTLANLSDIYFIAFSPSEAGLPPGTVLNIGTQLVGQSVPGNLPWGTPPSITNETQYGGDFAIEFSSSPPGSFAPRGNNWFYSEVTGGAAPQDMLLTSLTPVPLPAAAWLMLSGVGGFGVLARKKRAALSTASTLDVS